MSKKRYFEYKTSKTRGYYEYFAEFLDALAHFSNVKFMKYELDFGNPSEEAVEMFRSTYKYDGSVNDIRKGKAYADLMMSLYSCHGRCNRLAKELEQQYQTYAPDAPPAKDLCKIMDFLSFSPRGLSFGEKDRYNCRIHERSNELVGYDYIERLQTVYDIIQPLKDAGKIKSLSDICNICYYQEKINKAQDFILKTQEKIDKILAE